MKITGVGRAALMALGIAILAGCGKQDAQEPDMQREIGTYRAQDGTLSEHLYVTEEGYVQGFTGQEDTCDFQITVAEDGFYDLKFRAAGLGGYKENRILVDDISVGNLVSSTEEFEEKVIKRNFLSAGEHKITVEGYWGYIALDSLTVLESKELAADRELDVTLSNPDAGESARRLMSYLADQYGTNFISGQYCDGGLYGHEMACIFKATGKFPAMVGLDMMEYSPSRVANGSEGKSILLSDMDAVAKELQTLRDAKVPILWRPLHEASGGWFWWGDCSPDSYCELYRLMYEKFTKEYELDNLIFAFRGNYRTVSYLVLLSSYAAVFFVPGLWCYACTFLIEGVLRSYMPKPGGEENNSGISYHGSGGGVLWTDRTAGVCGSIHDAGAGEGNRQHLFDYGCGSGLCGVSVGSSGRFLSGRDC